MDAGSPALFRKSNPPLPGAMLYGLVLLLKVILPTVIVPSSVTVVGEPVIELPKAALSPAFCGIVELDQLEALSQLPLVGESQFAVTKLVSSKSASSTKTAPPLVPEPVARYGPQTRSTWTYAVF